MRQAGFARGGKVRLGRLGGTKRQAVWEMWVAKCDREICQALAGKRYRQGRGPQPRVDTPLIVSVSGFVCRRGAVRRGAASAGA